MSVPGVTTRLASLAGVLLVGVVSGGAGTVLHQRWWGLLLAVATALVVLAWLPAGGLRLAFALAWCVPVLRGALARPAGGHLISADAAGLSFLAASAVLLGAALATVGGARSTGRGRAEDPRVPGPAS
ncbi:hypothetical protein [Nocardioides xinjiangensis]|uniref:hypothetical protein n=1 Tax=Nocardioides xinjiangensis TaxID=2817376 RepID=UPI001B3170D7|nr:hypothetical protein [Nocardioides sp. SYSU D00778]